MWTLFAAIMMMYHELQTTKLDRGGGVGGMPPPQKMYVKTEINSFSLYLIISLTVDTDGNSMGQNFPA